MDTTQKAKMRELNQATANPDEAFERFIDTLLQLPHDVVPTPRCSWCDWRRGDSPRNTHFCAFHARLRSNLYGGL